ncbi:MAG: YdeI/OmpD-associated family protein [Actinobacteria bacterium]|nr:YdeI/OmpD-associated family protein [Actinomycetota bacterium]
MNRKVDIFLRKATQWEEEFKLLREIALDSGLTEDLKWGHPCYTLNNGNVILIHGFKEYCAILFFKGALLKDDKAILIQQTANVQSGRQIRFTSASQIIKMRRTLKSYISEAINVEEAGIKVELRKPSDLIIPKDIQATLKKIPGLAPAFKKLTPGRQRAYVLHFSSAKQEKTRDARIERCAPMILKGKGLNEY